MKKQTSEIDQAKTETQGVYERHALAWDRQRPRSLYEKLWLDRFAANILPGGKLLDLGCGSGDPVAEYFISLGFEVVGVDYSRNMISLAQERYPQASWIVQDMRMLDLESKFDGIYSWDGFFHLSVDEQRITLPVFANYVRSGGGLLLTVGPSEGEVTGTVAGETVYHASLSFDEYRQRLTEAGFENIQFVPEDPNAYGRSVLMASQKKVTL